MIWICGADGQVGVELRKRFKDIKNVIYTDKEVDITKAEVVKQFILDNKISLIINAAAYTNVNEAETTDRPLCEQVNVIGVKNLVDSGINLIHISSDYVYDDIPLNYYHYENEIGRPLNYYGLSKKLGDDYIIKYASKHPEYNYLILRVSWVYSDHHKNFVKTIFNALKSNNKLTVIDDQFGRLTHAADIADTIFILYKKMSRQYNGIYHYSGAGDIVSWYDIACEIRQFMIDKLKLDLDEIIPCKTTSSNIERPKNSKLSLEKIQNTFEIIIPNWRDCLQKCLYELKNKLD